MCRKIYEEGKVKGWPGLGKEVTEICQALNIPDVNDSVVSKAVIKGAIFAQRYEEMKQIISKMKKLDPIKTEDFTEVQNYFNEKPIDNGRMSFKLRSQMLEDVPGNFKNKYKNDKEKLKCQYCPEVEVMTRVTVWNAQNGKVSEKALPCQKLKIW